MNGHYVKPTPATTVSTRAGLLSQSTGSTSSGPAASLARPSASSSAPLTKTSRAQTTGDWSLVEDPEAWRRFVFDVIDRHHRVRQPGQSTDQCSCGGPFMLCSIAPLAERLMREEHDE